MDMNLKIIVLFLAAVTLFKIDALSQSIATSPVEPFYSHGESESAYDTWEIFTSHRSVIEIAKLDVNGFGDIAVLTTGGFYILRELSQVITYTKADGKYDIIATDMVYDEARDRLWFGYADGTLSYFDLKSFRFRHFNDIARNDRFVSNRVNHMTIHEDVLYIGTGFGLVLFDLENLLVKDSYTRFGRFSTAVSVLNVDIENDVIYLGTEAGIAIGNSGAADLKVPENWSNYDAQNGFTANAVQIVKAFGDEIYAHAGGSNYHYNGFSWSVTNIFEGHIQRIRKVDDANWNVITPGRIWRFQPSGMTKSELMSAPSSVVFVDYAQQSGAELAGTMQNGLSVLNSGGEMSFYQPEGPWLNLFEEIEYTERGELILGSSSTPGQFYTGFEDTGFSILNEGNWDNINNKTHEFLSAGGLNSFFSVASLGDDYFFGSWGNGIIRLNRSTGDLQHYNTQNSDLTGISPTSGFYVATGLARDRQDGNYVWAVSWSNLQNPLARYDRRTDEWESFPIVPQVGSNVLYREIFVDTYGQKWIPLMTPALVGRGLLVLKNPSGGSGEYVRLTSNEESGNLPSEKVNTIVQDRRGEIWIGTDRGMGRFLFPDRVIGGSVLERRAQPLINEDTTAFDRVLLRDVRVTSIVVDANNQKWVGSDGDGVYLIEESGRRVIRHFTTENSALTSNTIKSMTINNANGELYMATENSLIRYSTLEREGVRSMKSLRVYPNPYSYRQHEGTPIVIEDLSDNVTIHVMTVDGRLVRRLITRGGRTEWDGLDDQGQKVATGVYFVVATGNSNDQLGRGRIIIVR